MLKQIKRLAILAPFVALAGCAMGPTQLIKEIPDAVHTSDQKPEVVAACIDKKWENIRSDSIVVDVKTTDEGIRVTQRWADKLTYLALVQARGTGSRTLYWKQKVLEIGASKAQTDVALCQ